MVVQPKVKQFSYCGDESLAALTIQANLKLKQIMTTGGNEQRKDLTTLLYIFKSKIDKYPL